MPFPAGPGHSVSPRRREFLTGCSAALMAGTASGLGLTGCAAGPYLGPEREGSGEVLAAPQMRAGTSWRYRITNLFSGRPVEELAITVTGTSPLVARFRRSHIPGADGGQIASPGEDIEALFAQPWQVLVDPCFDATMRFAEPVTMIPQTLRVGMARATRTTYTVAGNSGALWWSQHLSVPGIDPVMTPAGQFRCLRIERNISFRHPDPFRIDSRRFERIWYSPEAGAIVRREWTGDYLHEGFIDVRPSPRRPEDRVRWDLLGSTAG